MENRGKLKLLVMTGFFAALITLFTAYICHIPVGLNGGYIHFGDGLIYIAASLLPQPYALCAAAIGGSLADILTAPMWAPATLLIKALMTLPFTSKAPMLLTRRNKLAPFISWLIDLFGYFLAEQLLFGTQTAVISSLLGNSIQSLGSLLLYFLLAGLLDKQDFKERLCISGGLHHHGTNSLYL